LETQCIVEVITWQEVDLKVCCLIPEMSWSAQQRCLSICHGKHSVLSIISGLTDPSAAFFQALIWQIAALSCPQNAADKETASEQLLLSCVKWEESCHTCLEYLRIVISNCMNVVDLFTSTHLLLSRDHIGRPDSTQLNWPQGLWSLN